MALALALFGAALLCRPDEALAYCRSTTCKGDCPRDENECKTTGRPLHWDTSCVGYSLQKDGTEFIDFGEVRRVMKECFAEWSLRGCPSGGIASMAVSELQDVACHRTEYNEDDPNANIVLFQDSRWTYRGIDNTLAKTTVSFDSDTGKILDADIEINHAYNEFTTTDDHVVYDLQAVITHEVGHFLGFDHTLDGQATMIASYGPGTTDLRTIEEDDINALCDTYPPDRKEKCETKPLNGLGNECGGDGGDDGAGGCSVATSARRTGSLSGFFTFLSMGVALALRRRTIRS